MRAAVAVAPTQLELALAVLAVAAREEFGRFLLQPQERLILEAVVVVVSMGHQASEQTVALA